MAQPGEPASPLGGTVLERCSAAEPCRGGGLAVVRDEADAGAGAVPDEVLPTRARSAHPARSRPVQRPDRELPRHQRRTAKTDAAHVLMKLDLADRSTPSCTRTNHARSNPAAAHDPTFPRPARTRRQVRDGETSLLMHPGPRWAATCAHSCAAANERSERRRVANPSGTRERHLGVRKGRATRCPWTTKTRGARDADV